MTEAIIYTTDQIYDQYMELKHQSPQTTIKTAAKHLGISKIYLSRILFSHYVDRIPAVWRKTNEDLLKRQNAQPKRSITIQIGTQLLDQFHQCAEKKRFRYVSRYLQSILPAFLQLQYQSVTAKTKDLPITKITTFSLDKKLLEEVDRFIEIGGKYSERSEFIRDAIKYALTLDT